MYHYVRHDPENKELSFGQSHVYSDEIIKKYNYHCEIFLTYLNDLDVCLRDINVYISGIRRLKIQ